ncbi:MAG TPA: LysM domain-containing protein [Elusimicrobiota bacterium]|nr:LysM domain-containing protein [Elusimicrobiota bacterium]
MLRLSRLHVLMLVVGLVVAGYGFYNWKNRSAAPAIPNPEQPSTKEESTAPDRLSKPSTVTPGNPAPAANPAATAPVAPDHTDVASAGHYEVVPGDTLWKIARDVSPVHQGPAWVVIWRANQRTVPNFNRLEVGWNLKIPAEPQRYVTAYWRPRTMRTARRHGHSASVIARSPIALPRDLELALLKNEPFPADLETALAASGSAAPVQLARSKPAALPKDVELALWRSQQEEAVPSNRSGNVLVSELPGQAVVEPPSLGSSVLLASYQRLSRPNMSMPRAVSTSY